MINFSQCNQLIFISALEQTPKSHWLMLCKDALSILRQNNHCRLLPLCNQAFLSVCKYVCVPCHPKTIHISTNTSSFYTKQVCSISQSSLKKIWILNVEVFSLWHGRFILHGGYDVRVCTLCYRRWRKTVHFFKASVIPFCVCWHSVHSRDDLEVKRCFPVFILPSVVYKIDHCEDGFPG